MPASGTTIRGTFIPASPVIAHTSFLCRTDGLEDDLTKLFGDWTVAIWRSHRKEDDVWGCSE